LAAQQCGKACLTGKPIDSFGGYASIRGVASRRVHERPERQSLSALRSGRGAFSSLGGRLYRPSRADRWTRATISLTFTSSLCRLRRSKNSTVFSAIFLPFG